MFAMFILSDFFTLYQSLDTKTNLNVIKRGLLIKLKKKACMFNKNSPEIFKGIFWNMQFISELNTH